MAYFVPCMYFHFRGMQIRFISKVTRVIKAGMAGNDTTLVLLVELTQSAGLKFPDDQTTKFVLVTKPGWLHSTCYTYDNIF